MEVGVGEAHHFTGDPICGNHAQALRTFAYPILVDYLVQQIAKRGFVDERAGIYESNQAVGKVRWRREKDHTASQQIGAKREANACQPGSRHRTLAEATGVYVVYST